MASEQLRERACVSVAGSGHQGSIAHVMDTVASGRRNVTLRGMSDVFEGLDERFAPCIKTSARLDRLYGGCRWAEGRGYFPAGRYLVWSHIPNDRMLRYDEAEDRVGVFRAPAGYTNGHTTDPSGRLVSFCLRDRGHPHHEHQEET